MPSHAPFIRRWFGLPMRFPRPARETASVIDILPDPGEVTLVTGPSGAGKSRLLARTRRAATGRTWIDPTINPLPRRRVIDCFGDLEALTVLDLLSRVGLAEAWTYLRHADELSVGQQFRLRLARCAAVLASASPAARGLTPTLVIDEFAAVLDRVTACVVARAVRKLVDRTPGLSAVLVTSHDDLARALLPDRTVRCDFEQFTVANKQKLEHQINIDEHG